MNGLLDKHILDNPIRVYLFVAGAILLALLIKRFISRYLAGLLYRVVITTGKKFNRDAFCNLVIAPLEFFLMALVIIVAVDKLQYPAQWNVSIYQLKVSAILDGLAKATLIIVFIWLCIRIIEFLAIMLEAKASISQSQTDNQLVVFFKDFFKVILVIIGILMFIHFVFKQDVGNLLTGLSIVGAAIALATRESLENLIASFIIFFDKPFVTGDTVKVHNFTGTIEKIGLRSTRIRTVDKTYISVPNKQMVDSIVDNISLRTQRRTTMRLSLRLSVKANDIRSIIAGIEQILHRPELLKSSVRFEDTGGNANVILVEYFTGMQLSDDDFNHVKQDINFQIKALAEQNRLEFATTGIEQLFAKSETAE